MNLEEKIHSLERELATLKSAVPLLAEPERFLSSLHFIEVRAGDSWWAVDIDSVDEVMPVVWPQAVTDAPAWMRGNFKIGPAVYALIDLNVRLGGSATPAPLHPGMWMMISHALSAAFLIDEATVARETAAENVLQAPPGIPQAPFLAGTLAGATANVRPILSLPRLAHAYFSAE